MKKLCWTQAEQTTSTTQNSEQMYFYILITANAIHAENYELPQILVSL